MLRPTPPLVLVATLLATALPSARAELDFNRDIKPIISENCYACHGPDEKSNKADLRLDNAEAAREVIASGEFLHRVTTDDPDEIMPPPEAKISLKPEERALLKQWLDAGAVYEKHWAFVSPEKATVKADANPIDQIVARHHTARKIAPTDRAEPVTLLRRVSLDLTGLPPTPEQAADFVADPSPANYAKHVDRLLASPAYGERMAWDWLDAARYADSNGYQGDNDRTMWPWRDWAVEAFNKNLPYDQFTIYQIAGDLMPNATFEQKLATGFLRNHPINGEGGRIAEENRAEYVMDMAETVATVWMGLTMNCCRCHDHKFDPITQAEYYQLTAYFNQTPVNGGGGNAQTPPTLAVPSEDQKSQLDAVAAEIAEVGETIAAREKHLAENPPPSDQRGPWAKLLPKDAKADSQTLTIQPDGSVLAGGPNPNKDTYTVTYPVGLEKLAAVRLQALPHSSMTAGGLARSDSANFVLTEIEVWLKKAGGEKGTKLKLESAEASFEQGSWLVNKTFDGNNGTGWAVLDGKYADKPQAAVFRLKEPVPAGAGSELAVILRHDSQHNHHNLGLFQIAATNNIGAPLEIDAKPTDPQIAELTKKRDDLTKKRDGINKATPKVMVMEDRKDKRETFILAVGNYANRLDKVEMGTPAALPAMSEELPVNRLGLAKWLVADENPLTARVTVNRIWQMFFGIGIVKTAEDFGMQAETPDMQDLLDHLAADFRDGWDLKALVRTIVTSDAYTRSSKAGSYADDPDNRLLARGPRFRMPSWMIRDHALATSGLLVDKVGGAPVNTYQPSGIWEEASFGKKRYGMGKGEDLHRRSLYTFWRRIVAPPAFFDNSDRTVCNVKPYLTNTPLHALYTLNDTTFVEAARHLAETMLVQEADALARLDELFRRVLGRYPNGVETDALSEQLARSGDQFAANPESATAFLNIGQHPRDKNLDQTEHAAWTALCLAVLNLDEALSK